MAEKEATALGSNELLYDVSAFEVSVVGTDWTQIVNARSAGQAKAEYWRQVRDAWPDVPYTDIRCHRVGRPVTSADFIRNAEYRGMPDVRCGTRVRVGDAQGVIVGHNASANFDVLFDGDATKYAGMRLSVHPQELEVI